MTSPCKTCSGCGNPYPRNPQYSAAQWERSKFCSRSCQREAARSERAMCGCGCGQQVSKPNSRFKQGHNPQAHRRKILKFDGRRWYVLDRHGRKTYWARIVMADVLGRWLAPGEVVHHINGDKQDDRPTNLGLFATQAEHMRAEFAEGNLTPIHAPSGGLAGAQGRISEWSCA